MALEIDYLPVATGVGANVDSQADFVESGYQMVGFVAGLAKSAQVNKVLRQTSMQASALANFISNTLGISVLDDGNLPALIANLTAAISASASGIVNGIINVPFSATPVFNAALGSSFQLTLSGPVTSSTIENAIPGQRIKIIIIQDANGNHPFVPPTNLPMSPIGLAANARSMQNFFVILGGAILQDGPLDIQ
jgi:hypothetical protein